MWCRYVGIICATNIVSVDGAFVRIVVGNINVACKMLVVPVFIELSLEDQVILKSVIIVLNII